VDIESSAIEIIDDVILEAKNNDTHVIVSHHNFANTPSTEEMLDVVERAHEKGAEIIKIATYINDDEDIKNLTSLLTGGDKKLVVIGMGSKGTITRLMFPAYGSLMTFCRLGQQTTAPGQLGLEEMAHHLRIYYPEYNHRVVEENHLMECV